MKIVLASKSPRRKEILEEQGYDVVVDVSNVDEDLIKKKDVKELVMELAKLKAEAVKERHKDDIIIAADTLVYFDGKEIGQQKSDDEAKETMEKLMGETHEVYSGVCVINTSNGKVEQDCEISKVKLKNVPKNTLKEYIKSGQYKGKAGAYNIADPEFESFVENVEGCKFNIMGLPIEKVKMMINKVL
tara:strand:+ start:2290 stop:2853 length:564 start_codon:yes stop_codon:yes gene_type:complete